MQLNISKKKVQIEDYLNIYLKQSIIFKLIIFFAKAFFSCLKNENFNEYKLLWTLLVLLDLSLTMNLSSNF